MRSTREATELRQYFTIKSDLALAVRVAAQDDIDFHLGELAVIEMHTTSNRLRRACRHVLAAFAVPVAAIHA